MKTKLSQQEQAILDAVRKWHWHAPYAQGKRTGENLQAVHDAATALWGDPRPNITRRHSRNE